jgi:hypothetical protein
LCPDCLLALESEDELEPEDESNDAVATLETVDATVTSIYLTLSPDKKLDEKFRQSLTESWQSNSEVKLQVKLLRNESSQMHCELLDVESQSSSEVAIRMLEHRSSGEPRQRAAAVSPETKKRAAPTGSKTCEECHEQEVPEEFMKYCKLCYAKRCRKMREQAGNDAELSSARSILPFATEATSTTTGKCRLCTGVVLDPSHEYCAKCYAAKQRDDSRRAQKQLYEAEKRKASAPRVPFVCIDCGGAIGDDLNGWKTKCRPCYARRPVPRLLHKPKQVLWIRKST